MSNEDLERAMTVASNDIKKGLGGKAQSGTEAKYGAAYSALVKVGLRPKLRLKYRRGLK